jgi:hypothetical protein
MNITISKAAVCGNVQIPPTEYWVSFNAAEGVMTLSAGGKDIRIKATRRRAAGKSKTTSIQFYSGGGKTWSLIVDAPKVGEWVSFIEYVD